MFIESSNQHTSERSLSQFIYSVTLLTDKITFTFIVNPFSPVEKCDLLHTQE